MTVNVGLIFTIGPETRLQMNNGILYLVEVQLFAKMLAKSTLWGGNVSVLRLQFVALRSSGQKIKFIQVYAMYLIYFNLTGLHRTT